MKNLFYREFSVADFWVATASERTPIEFGAAFESAPKNIIAPVTYARLESGGDIGDTPATAQALTIGETFSSDLSDGADRDWFAIDIVAGQSYFVEVTSSDRIFPDIEIRDEAGVLLFENDIYISFNYSFTATYTGIGYVDLGDDFGTANNLPYSIAVTEFEDDFGSTATTAGSLIDGASLSGAIQNTGDIDWFAIDVAAGESYFFTLDLGGGGSTGDINTQLLTASGQSANVSNYSSNSEQTDFTALATETLYISLSGLPLDYILSLNPVVNTSFPGDGVITVPVAIDEVVEATFENRNEIDWFEFTVDGAQGARLRFNYVDIQLDEEFPFPSEPEFTVYDSEGNQLFSSLNGDFRFVSDFEYYIDFATAAAGTFYIEVGSFELGTYSIGLETDISHYVTGSTVLAAGDDITTDLENSNDRDMFAIDVSEGEIFVFQMSSSSSLNYSFFDEDGNWIQFIEGVQDVAINFPDTTALVFSEELSGRFYIGVSSNFGSGYPIDYTVSSFALADTVGQTVSSAQLIEFDSTIQEKLYDVRDRDWFQFDAVAGEQYIFTITSHPFDNDYENGFALYDANGTELDPSTYVLYSPHGSNTVTLALNASVDGAFFLEVGGASFDRSGIDVAYEFTAERAIDAPADVTTPSNLWRNGSEVDGLMNSFGDVDWHRLEINASQTLTFDLLFDGERNTDANLIVMDEDGNFLGSLVGGPFQEQFLQYHFSDPGTYYVSVSGGEFLQRYSLSAEVASEGTPIAVQTNISALSQAPDGLNDFSRPDFGSVQLTDGNLLSYVVIDNGQRDQIYAQIADPSDPGAQPIELIPLAGTPLNLFNGYMEITAIANGFAIAYTEHLASGAVDVKLALFDHSGAQQSVTTLALTSGISITGLSLAENTETGNVIVVAAGAFETTAELRYAEVTPSGTTISQQLIETGSVAYRYFSVTALPDGREIISFGENSDQTGAITIAHNGATASFASSSLANGKVYLFGDGYVLVEPTSFTDNLANITFYTASGAQTGQSITISDPMQNAGGPVFEDLGDGTFVLSWTVGFHRYFQRYSTDGSSVGDVLSVDHTGHNTQARFELLSDGQLLVHAMSTIEVPGNGLRSIHTFDIFNFTDVLRANTDIYLTEFDDIANGGSAADVFFGLAGADTIDGGAGNDVILGGDQNDNLYGGSGNDQVLGQRGADFLYGGAGNDLVLGGNRNDRLFGEDGNDRVFGGNDQDIIDGGAGIDIGRGGNGDDILNGGDDGDVLFGGTGRDTVSGDGGDDVLFGRGGFDILIGGAGDDTLEGGLQADQFIFADGFGNDTITDFASLANGEKIHLTDVTEITDFQDLIDNHMSQVGADVVIADGLGNTITLLGVTLSDLDAVDFVF